jgi:hypothetical protein
MKMMNELIENIALLTPTLTLAPSESSYRGLIFEALIANALDGIA